MHDRADSVGERPSWLPDTPASRAQAAAQGEARDAVGPPPDEILGAYTWVGLGVCVACRRRKWTTSLRTFAAPGGGRSKPLLMCAACLLDEERARWRRCVERGIPYEPGRIGRPM